ncbi:hypothetical protein CHUAL_012227 [Chamberlinius hualienensis]
MAETNVTADVNTENPPEEEKNEAKTETTAAAAAPAPVKEMRAIVLTGFGGFKSVKVMKKSEPTPGEGEVLIRVKVCGLNFFDLMTRLGAIDNAPKTPFVLGCECAGEVEAVGENVTTYQPGDKVVALTDARAWAEAVVVPTRHIYKMPVGMSFQDAAALTMNFVVAYILLFDIAGLQKGKSLLIHSAGGGVGQAVAQLCKTVEDITIYGVASQSKHEAIKDSFAHLIDRSHDYVPEVRKLSPEGVDIVLDCLGGEDCNRGYGLLKPMGKYVLYGTSNIVTGETKSIFSLAKTWWQVDKVNPLKLYDENKSLGGLHFRHLLYNQGGHDYVRSVVEKIFKLWQEGKIKSVIDSIWAFEDVADAMQKLHDRKNVGKVVLDPAAEPKPKPPGKACKEGKDKEPKERTASESKAASVESADGDEAKEPVPSSAVEAPADQETEVVDVAEKK